MLHLHFMIIVVLYVAFTFAHWCAVHILTFHICNGDSEKGNYKLLRLLVRLSTFVLNGLPCLSCCSLAFEVNSNGLITTIVASGLEATRSWFLPTRMAITSEHAPMIFNAPSVSAWAT
jgi:hypothetical protein